MAILWSKQTKDTLYEVRSAGATRRLYSNGVLHSQFNPKQIISGAIWDLLLLPGFCLATPPKRVLILGLGGGTLVHTVRHFFPQAQITCVELDKTHIQIAKRWFAIPRDNVEIIHGDAYQYLRTSKGKFDWIVDDVFQHITGDPERGLPLDQTQHLYQQRLSKQGILSLNIIGSKQLRQAKALLADPRFENGLVFTHPLYDNRILCLLPPSGEAKPVIAKAIKRRFNQQTLLDQSRKSCRLKYRMQWVDPS